MGELANGSTGRCSFKSDKSSRTSLDINIIKYFHDMRPSDMIYGYSNHSEAALAIQVGNAQILYGKPIKCSWGSKPTPPGTSSTPLPPPAAFPCPGLLANDLLSYERSLALCKMGASQTALMQAQGQHALKQAALGMGAGTSQAIYDGGYQNIAASQQYMYY